MKLLALFLLLLCLPAGSKAQGKASLQKKIEALYGEALSLSRQGKSAQSTTLLYDILKLDSTCYRAHFALADLSHEAGNIPGEIKFLEKGISLAGDNYPAGYRFLAEALYKRGSYGEALGNIRHYTQTGKSLSPADRQLLASCEFSAEAVTHPVHFVPQDPGDSINTTSDEYWPSLNAEANELVFTRLLSVDSAGKKIAMPHEDFFSSTLGTIGWSKAKPLGPPVNTSENEGAQTLSADGKLLIFTGCGRKGGVGSCDLYISVRRKEGWSVPVNMGEPVNSGAWESQPSLTADGNALFFASSRKGGKGNMDIWLAVKTGVAADGIPQFGNVINLGELNTPGNDLSPFIHADGHTLYFASDGRPGLGGTDLFVTRLNSGSWTNPVNLGFPVNSKGNDEGLMVEISGERAWFTSNRNPVTGRDIYFFTLPDTLKPDPVSYLAGTVADAVTGVRLSPDIVLTDLKTNRTVKRILSAENEGEFLVCLPAGTSYSLSFSRQGYLFTSENISLEEHYTSKNPKNLKILLQPVVAGSSVTLKNIFFETNSWELAAASKTQLDEMALFMQRNPGVIMEVIGHTDHVGTETYNLNLSGKRAEAVVLGLKMRNIEPWRLKSRGAGFSVPVGDNGTEEGRRSNRRTEFLIREVLKN